MAADIIKILLSEDKTELYVPEHTYFELKDAASSKGLSLEAFVSSGLRQVVPADR
jgi:hypothetical protein